MAEMAPDDIREILARELYVHTAVNDRVYTDVARRVREIKRRHKWNLARHRVDRDEWRGRADRLIESLAASGIHPVPGEVVRHG